MKKASSLRLTGSIPFQAKAISLSYRYRGNVVRTHTQKKPTTNKNTVPSSLRGLPAPKRRPVRALSNRMLLYSAIKIKANPPAPYSILNPETSSLSPSAKSKGVRFVSARALTSQSRHAGALIRNRGSRLSSPSRLILRVAAKNINLIRIMASLTS